MMLTVATIGSSFLMPFEFLPNLSIGAPTGGEISGPSAAELSKAIELLRSAGISLKGSATGVDVESRRGISMSDLKRVLIQFHNFRLNSSPVEI